MTVARGANVSGVSRKAMIEAEEFFWRSTLSWNKLRGQLTSGRVEDTRLASGEGSRKLAK